MVRKLGQAQHPSDSCCFDKLDFMPLAPSCATTGRATLRMKLRQLRKNKVALSGFQPL
jgi:hypothetical protein